MYLNLALKNLKNNMRDYLVYFFTIAVSISLFYAFGVLDKSHYLMQTMGIVADYELSGINSGYNITSVGVGVILAIVIIYANTFFLKRRRKEIGVCLTLGMSKKSIAVVMFLEALGIGVISLVIGIILGIVISQLLAMGTLSLVGIGLSKYKFIFSFSAVVRTFIYFIIIFIIVGFYNITNVANGDVKELMRKAKMRRKSEKSLTGLRLRLESEKFQSGLAIGMIAIGAVIIGIGYILFLKISFSSFFYLVIISVVGIVTFLCGITLIVSKAIKANKKFYYSGINIFSTREVEGNIFKSLGLTVVVTILITLSIIIFIGGELTHIENTNGRNTAVPVGATLATYTNIDGFSSESDANFNEANIARLSKMPSMKKFDYSYLNMMKVQASNTVMYGVNEKPIAIPTGVSRIVSLKQFNAFEKLLGRKQIELSSDEVYVISNTKSVVNSLSDGKAKLRLSTPYGKKIKLILNVKGSSLMTIRDGVGYYDTCIIVPDNIEKLVLNGENNYKKLVNQYQQKLDKEYKEHKISKIKYYEGDTSLVDEYWGNTQVLSLVAKAEKYNTKEAYSEVLKDALTIVPKIKGMNGKSYPAQINMTDRFTVAQNLNTGTVSIVYSAVYVGIVFLIIAGAIMCLSELIIFSDEKEKYKTLRKLGVSKTMIKKSIAIQLLVKFLIPFIFAVVNGLVIMKIFTTLSNSGIPINFMKASLYSVGFVSIIYLIYIILAFIGVKRVIEK